jgi:naphthalene 1,2-dioxygenase system ferredoxin subunit
MSDDTGWVKAANRGSLGEGDVLGVVIGGKEIALYDLDGTLYATDDICTHAYAKLSDGWLDKGEIECPLHAGRFDVKTGRATAPPCIDASRPTRSGSSATKFGQAGLITTETQRSD